MYTMTTAVRAIYNRAQTTSQVKRRWSDIISQVHCHRFEYHYNHYMPTKEQITARLTVPKYHTFKLVITECIATQNPGMAN